MAGGVCLYSGGADVNTLTWHSKTCRRPPRRRRPTALSSVIRTVKEEFFDLALRQTFYDSVAALQADFNAWLVHYNTERPHRGYRNMGRRPIDTVNLFQGNVRNEG